MTVLIAGNDMASNCLVLDCPEYDTLLSLQPHSSFDYYSLYSRPIPEENTTCIPGVGMVYLHRGKVNYSEAVDLCENKGGRLASVVSESRTNGLSRLVATLGTQNKLTVAYVGLADTKVEGQFISSKNEPLRCFPYRAWAPSEPRHKKSREDCAVIDSRNSWRVVDCKSKHPFLCELTPSGPLQDDVQACYRLADIKMKAMCLARANYSEFLSTSENPDRCQELEAIGMANLNRTLSAEGSLHNATMGTQGAT
nr:PREDICTED: C-type lectin domain family 4 member E [Bemisia tabaci]